MKIAFIISIPLFLLTSCKNRHIHFENSKKINLNKVYSVNAPGKFVIIKDNENKEKGILTNGTITISYVLDACIHEDIIKTTTNSNITEKNETNNAISIIEKAKESKQIEIILTSANPKTNCDMLLKNRYRGLQLSSKCQSNSQADTIISILRSLKIEDRTAFNTE